MSMTPVALAELAQEQGDSADTSIGKEQEAKIPHILMDSFKIIKIYIFL